MAFLHEAKNQAETIEAGAAFIQCWPKRANSSTCPAAGFPAAETSHDRQGGDAGRRCIEQPRLLLASIGLGERLLVRRSASEPNRPHGGGMRMHREKPSGVAQGRYGRPHPIMVGRPALNGTRRRAEAGDAICPLT
jgi:hypothetical protein